MRVYHMIIEPKAFQGSDSAGKALRKEFLSATQGAAPAGWKCVGVCGYHDTPGRNPFLKKDGTPDMRFAQNKL